MNLLQIRYVLRPLLFLFLLISACQSTGVQTIAGETPNPSDGATPPLDIGSPEVEVNLEIGSGSFMLTDPRTGLDELTSYKASLTITFNGTESGQPTESSRSISMVQADPIARSLSIENNGESSATDPNFLAESDGAMFEVGKDGNCRIGVLDPENSLFDVLKPTELLSPILGADEAGQEEMNDVLANHYTFDEYAIVLSGVAESEGEVWVAADGGYILKYLVTTTGDEDYFGEGVEGTLTWEYSLTDVNQPLTLELPETCSEDLVSAPWLPDATNVVSLPNWLKFETSASLEEASVFYQDELPRLGWELTNAPPIGDMAAMAQMTPENLILLEFTKVTQVMYVTISLGSPATEVNILLSSTGE